jgi:hypothetical protein
MKIRIDHAALGFALLIWTAFLVPQTGFLWWIAGNFISAILEFIAAIPSQRNHVQSIALLAITIFVMTNGIAAVLACSTGGACSLIIAAILCLAPLEIAVALRGRKSSVPQN